MDGLRSVGFKLTNGVRGTGFILSLWMRGGGYYFGGDNPFFVDRGGTNGFDNVFFTDKFSTAYPLGQRTDWSMIAVIDRSIFEVFLDGGAEAATVTFFPTQPLTSLVVSSNNIPNGVEISVAVHAINSAWAQYENEQGTVFRDGFVQLDKIRTVVDSPDWCVCNLVPGPTIRIAAIGAEVSVASRVRRSLLPGSDLCAGR